MWLRGPTKSIYPQRALNISYVTRRPVCICAQESPNLKQICSVLTIPNPVLIGQSQLTSIVEFSLNNTNLQPVICNGSQNYLMGA